jgi:membrane protease YdiL (CAAX protease family)
MALLTNRVPLLPQGWQRAAVFCVLFTGCLVLTDIIERAMPVQDTGADAMLSPSTRWLMEVSIISILEIILVLVCCRFIDQRPVTDIGFAWQPARRDALTGFLLGPVLLGAGSLVLYVNGNLQWTGITFHGADFFTALVLMMLVAAGEELVVRGYLLRNLLQSFNKWMALGLSAAIFALAHINNPGIHGIALLNLLLGGLLLGLNYVYTRNIWFAICFHFSWNFFQGPVLGYEVSGLPLQSILQQQLSGPGWLTGFEFGFEGSVVASVVILVAFVLLYRAYRQKAER